jgi:hypothetical protein
MFAIVNRNATHIALAVVGDLCTAAECKVKTTITQTKEASVQVKETANPKNTEYESV